MGSTVNTMSEHDMHLLEPAPFGRILPAMVTPMKSDGSVDFAAALAEGSRFAVQFHPEKSHTHGLQLLQNFVAWDGRW